MNVTLSIDEQLLARARERLRAMGKSVNQEIRDHLQDLVNDEDLEAEFAAFRRLSEQQTATGWKWNRDDVYEERLKWPREQAAETRKLA